MSKKPTVLKILDGFGLNDKKDANAVYEEKTTVIDNKKVSRVLNSFDT